MLSKQTLVASLDARLRGHDVQLPPNYNVNSETPSRVPDRGADVAFAIGCVIPVVARYDLAIGILNGSRIADVRIPTAGTEYDFIPSDEKVQYYKDANANMLVGALLEDKAVIDELDGILEVKGIDYMSIGHNDFAQSIGYPGDSDNPAVQDQMNRIYDRIRAAGGNVAADIMVTDWVHGMLRRAGQELLAGK